MSKFHSSEIVVDTATASNLISALKGFELPTFTNSNRPGSAVQGQLIFNSDEDGVQVYNGSGWDDVKAGGSLNTWTTATRPGSPSQGTVGFATDTNKFEVYGSSSWITLDAVVNEPLNASGGNSTVDYEGYRYHIFTGDGSFTVSQGSSTIEYLIVAGGGGGGGGDVGAGGGAGGFRTNAQGYLSGGNNPPEAIMTISTGSYPVIVGNGGTGSASSPTDADSGQDSSFNGIVSLGGGGGASWGSATGRTGGSGGASVSTRAGAAGTAGQGFAGASGRGGPNYPQGGGGGAGGVGANALSNDYAGDGGPGLPNPFGEATQIGYRVNKTYWLAGGGGGGVESNAQVGRGGIGGGGIGGRQSPNTDPGNGQSQTGSGGGGEDSGRGGSGGSGIVILRYALA